MAGGMGQVWALVLFNKIATIVNVCVIKDLAKENK